MEFSMAEPWMRCVACIVAPLHSTSWLTPRPGHGRYCLSIFFEHLILRIHGHGIVHGQAVDLADFSGLKCLLPSTAMDNSMAWPWTLLTFMLCSGFSSMAMEFSMGMLWTFMTCLSSKIELQKRSNLHKNLETKIKPSIQHTKFKRKEENKNEN